MQPDEGVGATFSWDARGIAVSARPAGRGGFNKLSGSYSFPLRMKSSHPSRLRKLRLEAADAPRIDRGQLPQRTAEG